MTMSYTPFPGVSGQDVDENEWWLRREISLIQNLLKEEGETPRREIGERLGQKYWGPMRFRAALKEADQISLRVQSPRRMRSSAVPFASSARASGCSR
jgi:hypothetical protein